MNHDALETLYSQVRTAIALFGRKEVTQAITLNHLQGRIDGYVIARDRDAVANNRGVIDGTLVRGYRNTQTANVRTLLDAATR